MSETIYNYFDNVCESSSIKLREYNLNNNTLTESFRKWISDNALVLGPNDSINLWIENYLISTLEIADRNISTENLQNIVYTVYSSLFSLISPLTQQHQAYYVIRDEPYLFGKVSAQAQNEINSHYKGLIYDLSCDIKLHFQPDEMTNWKNNILFLISPYYLEILLNKYTFNVAIIYVEEEIHKLINKRKVCYFNTINHSERVVKSLKREHRSLFIFRNFTQYEPFTTIDSPYKSFELEISKICEDASALLDNPIKDNHKAAVELSNYFINNGIIALLDSLLNSDSTKKEWCRIRECVIQDFDKWCRRLVELSELSNQELNELIEDTTKKMLIVNALTLGIEKNTERNLITPSVFIERPIMEL